MTTPICPNCGSVKVKPSLVKPKQRLVCMDCGHGGRKPTFMTGGPGRPRKPNQKWRDPVALSMDGYDE